MHANADGTFYIAFGDGSSLRIGKVNADMTPVSGFGTGGLTAPVLMQDVNSMIIDSIGRILVSGTSSAGVQKVVCFASVGTLFATFATTLSLSVGLQIAEQESGRFIVAGKKGSTGSINAYQSTGLVEDITFGQVGNPGWYATGVDTQVDDLVVDDFDYIYCVYRDLSNHVSLQKLVANGSGLVPTFNSGVTIDTGIIATQQARIAINSDGNIVIGAV